MRVTEGTMWFSLFIQAALLGPTVQDTDARQTARRREGLLYPLCYVRSDPFGENSTLLNRSPQCGEGICS